MKRPFLLPLSTTTLCATFALLAYGCSIKTSTLGAGSFDGGSGRPDSGSTKVPGSPVEVSEEEKEDLDAGVDAASSETEKDADPPADHEDAEAGPPPRKRVFVTKQQFPGDLMTQGAGTDGLDGADRLCTAAAAAANLGGKWKAWLSTATVDARTRIVDVAPWYLVDRTTLVFETEAQLAGTPSHAINTNETGTISVSGGVVQRVWTGTRVGGTKATSHCEGWTKTVSAGGVGDYVKSDGDWTRYALDVSSTCAEKNPIYCFEQ